VQHTTANPRMLHFLVPPCRAAAPGLGSAPIFLLTEGNAPTELIQSLSDRLPCSNARLIPGDR